MLAQVRNELNDLFDSIFTRAHDNPLIQVHETSKVASERFISFSEHIFTRITYHTIDPEAMDTRVERYIEINTIKLDISSLDYESSLDMLKILNENYNVIDSPITTMVPCNDNDLIRYTLNKELERITQEGIYR